MIRPDPGNGVYNSTTVAHDQRRPPADYDLFVCGVDEPDAEMASIISRYLSRGGFHVFREDREPAGGSDDRRLALIDEIPDFVFLATPSGLAAAADTRHPVHHEIARALATGRNIVRVSPAGAPAPAPGALGPDLAGLAGQQAVVYDPDRLAQSLSILQHCLSSDTTVNERHLMRRAKRWFIFAALFVLAGVSWQTVPPLVRTWMRPKPLPPVAPLTLYWAGFGQHADHGSWVERPLVPGHPVPGGDQVRVAFSLSADGFAYVIARDARGRVSVLFPSDAVRGASRVRRGRVYQAPVESGWLTVDPQAGLDAIYVFASYDPLQNLEELVEQAETPANLGARSELVDVTIAGLLDGRHYQLGRQLWIRSRQFVDQDLPPAPGPARFTVPLDSGGTATHAATVQPGLVSALGEITFSAVGRPPGAVAR
jgi:Domain of unknown function (DUF4384)